MKKLFMPITHNEVVAGYVAEGYGPNMSNMQTEDGKFLALSLFGNKRSFSVHEAHNKDVIGYVHYICGGRYVAVTMDRQEIVSLVGSDAEIKCFVAVVQHYNKS